MSWGCHLRPVRCSPPPSRAGRRAFAFRGGGLGRFRCFSAGSFQGLRPDEVGRGDVLPLRRLPVIRRDELVHSRNRKNTTAETANVSRYLMAFAPASAVFNGDDGDVRTPAITDLVHDHHHQTGRIRCRPGSPRRFPGSPPAAASMFSTHRTSTMRLSTQTLRSHRTATMMFLLHRLGVLALRAVDLPPDS